MLAGQFLLILPHGSHGVFAPDYRDNAHLKPFVVSAIRAAEIVLTKVRANVNDPLQGLKAFNSMQQFFVAAETNYLQTISENERLKRKHADLEARLLDSETTQFEASVQVEQPREKQTKHHHWKPEEKLEIEKLFKSFALTYETQTPTVRALTELVSKQVNHTFKAVEYQLRKMDCYKQYLENREEFMSKLRAEMAQNN